jgi:hypothetical protein
MTSGFGYQAGVLRKIDLSTIRSEAMLSSWK